MYSKRAQDHIGNLRNVGPPAGCNRTGICGSHGDGPFIAIYLRVDSSRIVGAGYHTYVCPAAIACASEVAESVVGLSSTEASLLTSDWLIETLGGLPEGKHDRAELAINALKAALDSELYEDGSNE